MSRLGVAALFMVALGLMTCGDRTPVIGQPSNPHAATKPGTDETQALIESLVHARQTVLGRVGDPITPSFLPLVVPTVYEGTIRPADKAANKDIAPAYLSLIREGAKALPALIAHVSDPRPTQATITFYEDLPPYGTDYDPRIGSEEDKLPPESTTFGLGPLKYQLTVGDFCYSAIGEITNRDLDVIHGLQADEIDSPVHTPWLAARVRKDWTGTTSAQLRNSLVTDALDYYDFYGGRTLGGIERLCYYYPTVGEPLAVRLLGRRLYRYSIAMDFIDSSLVRGGGSQSLAQPPTGGPAQWKARFAAFLRKHGPEYGPAVESSLVAWYFPEAPNGNGNTPAERRQARAVFSALFPLAKPSHSELLGATSPLEMDRLIQHLLWVKGAHMDGAVFKVLSALSDFDAKSDPTDIDEDFQADLCALDVMGRLAGHKEYAPTFARFCRRRIAALTAYRRSNQANIDRASEGGARGYEVDYGTPEHLAKYRSFLREFTGHG